MLVTYLAVNTFQIVFLLAVSVIFALLEIQIEGSEGWAENLPTWKVKNPFRKVVGWPTLADGYHFWMWVFVILIFHAPFFFGFPFNQINELLIIEMIFIFFLLEDFLWFVFNPSWGLKNFFTKEIPWHPHKIMFLPQNYWIGFVLLAIFEIVKNTMI